MNKIIAVLLAAAALFFFWQIVPTESIPKIAQSIEHPYAASVVKQEGANRELLSDQNKELYDVIKSGLINYDEEILVRRFAYGEEDIREVLWYIMSDSPELFWVDWSWSVRSQDNGFVVIPQYIFPKAEADTRASEFNTAVETIVKQANEAGATTDYAKVLFVHDYLINNCKYNEESTLQIHTAYGAIVAKEAVCDGYAHAAQLLLSKLGVSSVYVEGTTIPATRAEGHAWNIVTVDGASYQMDITWDDRDAEHSKDGFDNILSYNYFLISDTDMAIDHKVDNRIELPPCPDGYGYFKKLGLEGNLFEDIANNVEELIVKNVQNDIFFIEFRIADPADYKDVCESSEAIGTIIDNVNDTLYYDTESLVQLGNKYAIYRSDERNSALVVFTVED